ncbi:hypothetical protein BECAL_02520 [Bellilinea caldifistulae]|nr:hypothetical protein BECAL_02520 [Bellilinea caldifistulae]
MILLASIPLLVWSLGSTPLNEIVQVFSRLHLAQVMILAGVNILVFLLIALRWEIILRAMGMKVPLNKLVSYRLTSFGVSYFTPGPQFGGEPAQVAFLTRHHPVQTPAAISSVYLDKLLELLVNILVIFGGLFLTLNAGFGSHILQPKWLGPGFAGGCGSHDSSGCLEKPLISYQVAGRKEWSPPFKPAMDAENQSTAG